MIKTRLEADDYNIKLEKAERENKLLKDEVNIEIDQVTTGCEVGNNSLMLVAIIYILKFSTSPSDGDRKGNRMVSITAAILKWGFESLSSSITVLFR